MPIDVPHLLSARALGDGRFVAEEIGGDVGDAVRRLREYDPRCHLVRNPVRDRWEVWRDPEHGDRPSLVMSRPGARVPHADTMIAHLAAHDQARGFDPIREVEAHNAALERDRQRRFDDEAADKADKLAWALARDLDEPAPSGRLYPLGTAAR